MKVFISYSHHQAEWVRGQLYACLSAGGAEVLIDVRQFQAGLPVYTQMDAQQDAADIQILVLSPEYLASAACLHEMDRAVGADPAFASGRVIPVVRVAVPSRPRFGRRIHYGWIFPTTRRRRSGSGCSTGAAWIWARRRLPGWRRSSRCASSSAGENR